MNIYVKRNRIGPWLT